LRQSARHGQEDTVKAMPGFFGFPVKRVPIYTRHLQRIKQESIGILKIT